MRFDQIEVGDTFILLGNNYVKIDEIQPLHTPLARKNAACWCGRGAGGLVTIEPYEDVFRTLKKAKEASDD